MANPRRRGYIRHPLLNVFFLVCKLLARFDVRKKILSEKILYEVNHGLQEILPSSREEQAEEFLRN